MGFILSHWHCILPVVGVIIGIILLRDKPKDNKMHENVQSNSNFDKQN